MRNLAWRAGLLLGPFIVLFVVVFAMYGPEGPPDTPRANAVTQLMGTVYGIYIVAIVIFWLARRRKKAR
jgi:hypothetical protein